MTDDDGRARFDGLTALQRDTLAAVAEGFTSKEIAAREGVHYRTVDARVERAVATLKVRNRAEAARLYREHLTHSAAYDRTTYDPPGLGETDAPASETASANRLSDGEVEPFKWAPPPPPTQPERVGIWIDLGGGAGGKLRAAAMGMVVIAIATLLIALLYDTVQHRIDQSSPSRPVETR